MLSCFSSVRFCVIPWIIDTPQASLSMGILHARLLEWVAMLSSKSNYISVKKKAKNVSKILDLFTRNFQNINTWLH